MIWKEASSWFLIFWHSTLFWSNHLIIWSSDHHLEALCTVCLIILRVEFSIKLLSEMETMLKILKHCSKCQKCSNTVQNVQTLLKMLIIFLNLLDKVTCIRGSGNIPCERPANNNISKNNNNLPTTCVIVFWSNANWTLDSWQLNWW